MDKYKAIEYFNTSNSLLIQWSAVNLTYRSISFLIAQLLNHSAEVILSGICSIIFLRFTYA